MMNSALTEAVYYILLSLMQPMHGYGITQNVGTYGRQAYFRKKTADGSFNLFSDSASRIKPMNYLISLLAILICPNMYGVGINIYAYILVRHPAKLFAAIMNLLMIGLLSTGIIKLCRKNQGRTEDF